MRLGRAPRPHGHGVGRRGRRRHHRGRQHPAVEPKDAGGALATRWRYTAGTCAASRSAATRSLAAAVTRRPMWTLRAAGARAPATAPPRSRSMPMAPTPWPRARRPSFGGACAVVRRVWRSSALHRPRQAQCDRQLYLRGDGARVPAAFVFGSSRARARAGEHRLTRWVVPCAGRGVFASSKHVSIHSRSVLGGCDPMVG